MDDIDFDREESDRFAEYWLSLRDNDLVPAKAKLNPARIKDLLPYLMIFERVSTNSFLIRLVGTEIVRRRGKDSTGNKLESYARGSGVSPFLQNLLSVLDRPCGYLTISVEEYTSGAKTFIELSGFPFADDQGIPRYVVSLAIDCSASFTHRNKNYLLNQNQTTRQIWQWHKFVDIGAGLPELLIPTKEGIKPVYHEKQL